MFQHLQGPGLSCVGFGGALGSEGGGQSPGSGVRCPGVICLPQAVLRYLTRREASAMSPLTEQS